MDKKKLKKLLIGDFSLKRLIRSVIFIYFCLAIYACSYADRIIFLPQPPTYTDGPGIIKLKTADGTIISAIHLPNPNADFTILYSHGNAEDIGGIEPTLREFYAKGFSVFAYDYHGYGTSQGRPTEKNAYRDVKAAYDYMVNQLKIEPNRVIAMGRSVGGGPAVHIASQTHVGGLILESAFVSAFRVRTIIPLLPFDKFNNIAKIKKVNCPLLVIHGNDDDLIPVWHGKALFKKANLPKFNLWIDGAGHNDDLIFAAGDSYWIAIEKLVSAVKEKNGESRRE